jgi:hypothetical protein
MGVLTRKQNAPDVDMASLPPALRDRFAPVPSAVDHENVFVAVVKSDDLHRGGECDPVPQWVHGNAAAVVAAHGDNGVVLYYASLVDYRPSRTFAPVGEPVELRVDVHMSWPDSFEYGLDMGTILRVHPWHKFVVPVAYDDFVTLWRGARHHPALESGKFVYQ